MSGRFGHLLCDAKMFNIGVRSSHLPTHFPFPGTPSPRRDRHRGPAAARVSLEGAYHRRLAKARPNGRLGDGDSRESEFHGVQTTVVQCVNRDIPASWLGHGPRPVKCRRKVKQ